MGIIPLPPLFILTAVAAAQPQTPAGYTYCYASINSTQYFTAPMAVAPRDTKPRLAFLRHLEQTYGFKGLVQCTQLRSKEIVEAELRKLVDDATRAGRIKFMVMGWVYTPEASPSAASSAHSAPAAPPAPAAPSPSPALARPAPPAPSASSASIHAVCWADFDPKTRYYSAVFDGTKGDYGIWMATFKGYLYGRYEYNGQVRCTKKPSKAEAQTYWDDMIATARGLTLAGGVKPRIIETGWAYK